MAALFKKYGSLQKYKNTVHWKQRSMPAFVKVRSETNIAKYALA